MIGRGSRGLRVREARKRSHIRSGIQLGPGRWLYSCTTRLGSPSVSEGRLWPCRRKTDEGLVRVHCRLGCIETGLRGRDTAAAVTQPAEQRAADVWALPQHRLSIRVAPYSTDSYSHYYFRPPALVVSAAKKERQIH